MVKHPFIVKLDMHVSGYEKSVTLVGEARNEAEAETFALLAESHTDIEEDEHTANGYYDDCFFYVVNHVYQIPYDEYVVLKKYIGEW